MRQHITFPIILISLFIIGNSYADNQPPIVTNCSPTAGSIQVPLNNLISFNITDADPGVYADSVEVKVNGKTVYKDGKALNGNCQMLGKKRDYTFIYQSNVTFDYEQTVVIKITAKDFAGNELSYTYYIMTEMRSFGQNKKVNSGLDNLNCNNPVTVYDSSGGNIWVAWHAGPIGSRDIYIGKLAAGADNFDTSVKLTANAADQCYPAIALDSSNKLYVVWQDKRQGNWDIYVSTSNDGISWTTETKVNDESDDNQINPAIVIDGQSPNQAHVVWQDDRGGNQNIFIASSSDGFATKTFAKITSDTFDQVEPAVAADSGNTIYVVWTDGRNSSTDIYGAASNNGWANVEVVNDPNNQSSPVIAAESTGTILHLLWVDDTDPNGSIFYASTTDGLQGLSSIDPNVVNEDERVYMQKEPTIAVTGSTVNNLKVFACWQDWRNVNSTNTNDTDLYFTELSSGSGTNIFVSDEGTNSYQGEPAIGIDKYGFPYLVWTDGRNTNTDIYYAGSTFTEPLPIWTQLVPHLTGANYGDKVGHLRSPGDISIKVPPRAFPCDVTISASGIKNPQGFGARKSVGNFEFGPSGIQFGVPITITIAYAPLSAPAEVYWYDPVTDTFRQDGITNVTHIERPTVDLVRFKTRHFTPFYLFEGSAAAAGGGGGGGGCSMSPYGQGSIIEFLLPYTAIVIVLLAIRWVDTRRKKGWRRELRAN